MNRWFAIFLAVAFLAPESPLPGATKSNSILMVVMDPLSRELACACVAGRGQRNYRKLATHLGKELGKSVKIEFSDDLADTLGLVEHGPEIIVIGESAVVGKDAQRAKLKLHRVCELTDPDGTVTMSGSFVVRGGDPARSVKDLSGRPLYLGMADVEENIQEIRSALKKVGVSGFEKPAATGDFSNMVLDVLDSRAKPGPVAVVPSYAVPLLLGCGSVRKGEVRVLGNTAPLPFVNVFLSDGIAPYQRLQIVATLLAIPKGSDLLKALESRDGFRRIRLPSPPVIKPEARGDWPDWRGPRRDGIVPSLPARLPATRKMVWKRPAMTSALSGLSVHDGRLLVAERDLGDKLDVYRCLNADTGDQIWRIEFPAPGTLDYGQATRATPVFYGKLVYLLSAFGTLRCVDVTNGKVRWSRDLPKEFDAELPTWGMSATPLLVNGTLIVNPGGSKGALAALDCHTGQTKWVAKGMPAAYSSFVMATFSGRSQIIGYDQKTIGGWDVNTGARLWLVRPRMEGDFNVPTPVVLPDGLLLATENNGTRIYGFDGVGRMKPEPIGHCGDLTPETTTPVVIRGRVFGVSGTIQCLDLNDGLKQIWELDDIDSLDHASLFADDERVLVVTMSGELILLDAKAEKDPVISRLKTFDDEVEVYSHPALVGTRLFIRGGYRLMCLELGENES